MPNSEKRESRQEDFDLHYEKINEMYYSGDKFVEESFYSNRTESIVSKDVHGNNAELILRELFVPVKEEDHPKPQHPRAPRHWSVKDFRSRPTSRRSTSDFHVTKKLHSSLKQRSSLQGMMMRSSVSSSSVMTPEDNWTSIQRRRPAIIFNSQLSYSDATHSTMV